MFLQRYATARARGAVLYNAFLCKSFVAENAQLTPSTEPNLMKRPGCQTCHATLEPLAAYFARIEPSSSVFLPATNFPAASAACRKDKSGKLNGNCGNNYRTHAQNQQGLFDMVATLLRALDATPPHAADQPGDGA